MKALTDEDICQIMASKEYAEGIKIDKEIKGNKYTRKIVGHKGGISYVDVYDVLKAFNVNNPALQHLIKKALCVGIRGHKDTDTDLQDIIDSAIRAKELEYLEKDK